MESDKKFTISQQNMHIVSTWHQTYYKWCKEELIVLKSRKVWCQITFYDLLNKAINNLIRYTRNKKLLSNLNSSSYEEQFSIYGIFIKLRVEMALTNKELIDKSLEVLTKLFSFDRRPKSPHFFGLEVVQSLNTFDLESLSKA